MYSQWETWNTKSDVHVIIDCTFNWHTVKPPFNRHPCDQKNCPLKRHVCLWQVKILLSFHSVRYHYKFNTVWSGHRWKTLQEKRRKARNALNLLYKDNCQWNKPSPYHSLNSAFRKLTFCYIVNPCVHDLNRKAWKPACYLRTLRGKKNEV